MQIRDPIIIAEIGINHNGDLNTALELIKMADRCGCDYVKFQKRNPNVCVPEEQKKVIRKDTPWGDISYLDYRYKVEFGKEEYNKIHRLCSGLGIGWFASAWDLDSVEFLKQYDLECNKIASPMIYYDNLVRAIVEQRKLTYISTGACDLVRINEVAQTFRIYNCPFILMHCVSQYPCPDNKCNLSLMEKYRDLFACDVGYSGHERGLLPSQLAVAMGAIAIERHITLDRTMWGSDQMASLDEQHLSLLVKGCRATREIYGDGQKVFTSEEKKKMKSLRWYE